MLLQAEDEALHGSLAPAALKARDEWNKSIKQLMADQLR
jgi:hypothetical protein